MANRLDQALRLIDDKNSEDPNKEELQGKSYPKELLYAQRMTLQLLEFKPDASEELQIAARAQHICRWKIPREKYPMDRPGYFKWRNDLKLEHAKITRGILEEVGYQEAIIERVSFLIQKKKIKKDADSQTLEDVICLVFLQYYFDDFATKHKDDKLIDIIQKTWRKMSAKGHKAALELPLSPKTLSLVNQALS